MKQGTVESFFKVKCSVSNVKFKTGGQVAPFIFIKIRADFLSPAETEHGTYIFCLLLFLCTRFSWKDGKYMNWHEIPNLYIIIDISYYYHFHKSRVWGFITAIFVGFQRYKKNDYSYCFCKCHIFPSIHLFLWKFPAPSVLEEILFFNDPKIQQFHDISKKGKTLLKSILPAQMWVSWCISTWAADRISVMLRNETCNLPSLRFRKKQGTSNFTYILKWKKEWSKAFSFSISSIECTQEDKSD